MRIFTNIWRLYYDGFRNMPGWGKSLWLIVIIKLCAMFLVFRLFLMPNYLNSRYDTFQEKSDHVFEQLITKP
ncbi:MAG: DUF4492 domain-containing protein [Odoribacteraceae bacterium]|jgi:hypothetical protein|nr:DUF4492 domain-containing protein [Odoribacteraceae bacterium]